MKRAIGDDEQARRVRQMGEQRIPYPADAILPRRVGKRLRYGSRPSPLPWPPARVVSAIAGSSLSTSPRARAEPGRADSHRSVNTKAR